jgi:putative nucleotidyltransferase with HDIG domain
MDEAQAAGVREWFSVYVDRFRSGGALSPALELKLDHSLRVAADAAEIARESGWPAGAVRTARTLGLLHDVGRFPQFAEFGTFNDSRSVDHGDRGLQVLEREGTLADLDGTCRRGILDGVRHHNARALPEGLADESLRLARAVRDADKLDICRVVLQALDGGQADATAGLLGGLDPRASPSADVLDCLRQGHVVASKTVRNLADLLLLQASWVYDVNYPAAMRRLRDRRVLERIQRGLPDDPEVGEVVRRAMDFRDGALAGPLASGFAGARLDAGSSA